MHTHTHTSLSGYDPSMVIGWTVGQGQLGPCIPVPTGSVLTLFSSGQDLAGRRGSFTLVFVFLVYLFVAVVCDNQW